MMFLRAILTLATLYQVIGAALDAPTFILWLFVGTFVLLALLDLGNGFITQAVLREKLPLDDK